MLLLTRSRIMSDSLNGWFKLSDEEIFRMAITSRTGIIVSADTPIYVVLEQTPKVDAASGSSNSRNSQSLKTNAEELRQLLQLKRELNQSSPAPQ